jgi:prevent-host-death family protein
MQMTRSVDASELRRNLRRYVKRAERGERFEVTDHGRAVAVLGPIGEPAGPLQRLVAAGRVAPPVGDLLDLLPPRGRPTTRTSEALSKERAERS